MRIRCFAALIVALPSVAAAETKEPFGWDHCNTVLSGDPQRCAEYVENSCTTGDLDACKADHTHAWFAYGANTSLAKAAKPVEPGKPISLKSLNRSIQRSANYTGNCAKYDVDCKFRTVIRNVLKEHRSDAQ